MKYFAYGSNMDPDRLKERRVEFSERELAILNGYSLKFNKQSSKNPTEGFANIVTDPNRQVEGVLYEISDEGLRKLDKCEAYPDHYNRTTITVTLNDQSEIDAVVYIAQQGEVREGLKPSRQYLNYLLKGKGILTTQYFEKLSETSTL